MSFLSDALRAARELRALAGEVAEVDLRHPAWAVLVGGTALLETMARHAPSLVEDDPYAAYLGANGGPRSDTFMARPHRASTDAGERIARAVARARRACAVLDHLEGGFPGQPLRQALAWSDSWLRRVPAGDHAAAAVVTPRGVFLLDPAVADPVLARGLGAVLAGHRSATGLSPVDPASPTPLRASVAVDLSRQPAPTARHLHRRAWTTGGGPWLGLGETDDLELVTTCHLVVDGFGHGLIAGAIFRDLDASNVKELVTAAREGLAGTDLPVTTAPPVSGALPLGFASRLLPSEGLRFARLAYALARLLDRTLGSGRGPSPTLQIPVAPGSRDDPDRLRRRVNFGVVAAHRVNGELETYASFRERLRTVVDREAFAGGLLSRVLLATANAPLPRHLKRRLLSTRGHANRYLPPVEIMAGRGQLSLIRYPPSERPGAPLYGLSSPGLEASATDPLGSFVVTLVDHGEQCSLAVGGTGRAGDAAGAAEILDGLLDEVARVATMA